MVRTITIAALGLTALLSSCGIGLRVGPDYERPIEDIDIHDSFVQEADTSSFLPIAAWWEVFGDTTLNRLVDEAIDNNLDIRKAGAVVMELRARNVQSRADRFPSINLNGNYDKKSLPESYSTPGMMAGSETESYNLSVAASHEVDLWGKMSRAHEAARADLESSIENRNIIIQSITAETVTLYLQMEALERRIHIARDLVTSYRKSVRTIEGRYRRGLTSILDLKQAQRALAGGESALPQLRQELGSVQHLLSVILGRYPESSPPRLQPEDYFGRLDPVPPGLPSDLLENRPDIMAAESRLQALNARYGVATANLFPRITLTHSFGYTSPELENLFRPDNVLWNLVAGITQPIFHSGKLLAERKAARARYDQGVADYAKTVLCAFAEVENALLTRREQLGRREHIIDLLEKARITQEIAEHRYARGLISYLTVLDACKVRYQAEDSLVLVDLAILTNRVALHRALGGNWTEPEKKKEVDK